MLFDLAHSFVNIFAGGLSDIKTIIFFIYLVLLVGIFLIFKNHNFKILKWKWFGISVGLMYLYGLILHLIYTISNHLPITKYFITGGNGEVSTSYIGHIHVAKATISQVLFYFGKVKLQTIDAGGAYLGSFSSPVFLLGALLLLVLIVQSFLYFGISFLSLLKNKNKRQIIFLITAYAIVSLSLIKTAIDGGIFNRGLLISALFVIFFILQEKKKILNYHYYIISLFGLILSIISIVLINLKYWASFDIASMAALILLYNTILYGSKKKINNLILILFFVLFLGSWWIYGVRDRMIYKYSTTILPVGAKVYVYDESLRDVQILEIERAQTIARLAKSLNKNIEYSPIMADGVNCKAGKPVISFSITLVSDKPLTKNYFTNSEDIIIKNEASTVFSNRWQTRLFVYLNPCLKETLTIINGELTKNNINNYLLVDAKIPRNLNIVW